MHGYSFLTVSTSVIYADLYQHKVLTRAKELAI